MFEKKFQDFGLNFEIQETQNSPSKIQSEFNDEINNIDTTLFNYYQKISTQFKSAYFLLNVFLDDKYQTIGYARVVEDDYYWNLYEIFINKNYREMGLGTRLFEYISFVSSKNNFQIRTYALPSDRQAKNFYESNAITAKLLIMEKKREHNRYRP